MASNTPTAPALQRIDANEGCNFTTPTKRINDGDDVTSFLGSKAYADIMTLIFQLNTAMVPRTTVEATSNTTTAKEWTLNDSDVSFPPIVQNIAKLLETLTSVIDEAPPDPGPRRFGNVSFRTWYDIVRERVPNLLDEFVPKEVLQFKSTSEHPANIELEAYLIGSFGSSQRLDYGTGHELSFLAFLGCLWKLGAFPTSTDGDVERAIVLGVIEPYLVLIRRLILTYTLEPAGSHGVWGLDDHAFIPYILGSAQFSPAISSPGDIVTEGSLPSAPDPGNVAKAPAVERERKRNMYFAAIGFIYDVKKGPFWEHSPILYDISGVKAGWAKINKGMIKMYNAEVLSKFPVVQHFPFGSLFSFDRDPNAKAIAASVHTSSQPRSNSSTVPSSTSSTSAYSSPRQLPPSQASQAPLRNPLAPPQSQAPLRNPMADGGAMTAAPWAKVTPTASQASLRSSVTGGMTAAPWATPMTSRPAAGPNVPSGPDKPTRAPWTSRTPASPPPTESTSRVPPGGDVVTKAPWAK